MTDRATGGAWRAAVLACTHELASHLLEQRWGRVDEAMRERRELLAGLGACRWMQKGAAACASLTEAAGSPRIGHRRNDGRS